MGRFRGNFSHGLGCGMWPRTTSCACAPLRHDQLEGLEVVPIEAPVPRQQPVCLDEGVAAHQEVGDDAVLPLGAFSEPVPALRAAASLIAE